MYMHLVIFLGFKIYKLWKCTEYCLTLLYKNISANNQYAALKIAFGLVEI